nr:MAG TPA: hypothetical protein [Caudoviricetes sp.]
MVLPSRQEYVPTNQSISKMVDINFVKNHSFINNIF